MRFSWALVALTLVGCAEEEIVFHGDWSCDDKPNKRPTWTFEAKATGPEIREVFADPVFKNLITLGTVELERTDGANWIFEGKMPTDLEFGIDIGGQDLGVEENCEDVTSVLYQLVLDNGESTDFQVKKGSRGKKQTN